MKVVRVLVALVGLAVLMVAPPIAAAYDVLLTQWNVTQLNTAGDSVKVTISGNTITFLWQEGDGISPAGANLKHLYWSLAVFTEGGGTGTGTGDYTALTDCGINGCQAAGFGKYRVKAVDDSPDTKTIGPVSFTFANSLTDAASTTFTATDFVVHVQYDLNCSGFVDGSNGGTPTSSGNCTPVPEPMTVFLGGTGLLIMGYFVRKRLFGGRL